MELEAVPGLCGWCGAEFLWVGEIWGLGLRGCSKAYCFAYEIGLVASLFTYWLACWWSPPASMVPLGEWREPKDYVRSEERGE